MKWIGALDYRIKALQGYRHRTLAADAHTHPWVSRAVSITSIASFTREEIGASEAASAYTDAATCSMFRTAIMTLGGKVRDAGGPG
jgi:hypothetical protein